MIKKINKQEGYTIIETMIAVSLFIVIVMLGTGSLLNANLLHQKSRDMRSILDNLSFVMDDMSRNIRTGYSYHCIDNNDPSLVDTTARSCVNGGLGISFKSASPTSQWVYFISTTGKIFRATHAPYTDPSIDPASAFVQLNPDEITIDRVNGFSIFGAEPPPGDTQQPFVTIRLVGHITFKNVSTPFSLQTSVSQRLIDVGN